MPSGRSPGLELDPAFPVPVRNHVAQLESRGRLYLPPWLCREAPWLTPEGRSLAVFDEPGLIRLLPWEPDGEAVVIRRRELAAAGNLEAISALQDRYRSIQVPADSRPVLGDAALVHLGLTELRRPYVYIVRFTASVKLMSPRYRNRELARLRPVFESLP